ncbi:MAG: energy-coupling factor transporter transmembrane component T [Oscillospiraceae bacterium]
MRDTFSGYHPLVNFLYFLLVLLFSVFVMHPVLLGVTLIGSLTYSIYLRGRKAVRFALIYMLPLLIITALLNPAFNHEGATMLYYLPDGNPLTLESIVYGIAAATMMISVMCWFSCYNEVFTSDKFIYLFGRIIPAMSLILSMSLRFVPRFKAQLNVVMQAQRCLGRDIHTGSVMSRIRTAVTILSVMVTWALENSIETADSMKSRGYGLPGRTAYSIYRFEKRDGYALVWLSACGAILAAGIFGGGFAWRYFPTVRFTISGPVPFALFCIYAAMCLTPVAINVREDMKWNALNSKI